MKYKSNNNIVYSCKYHVVFCPISIIKQYIESQKRSE